MQDRKKLCQMLTVEEAAEQLGVSVACLRAWILARKIDYVKFHHTVRIKQSTIDRMVADGTVAARKSA